MSTNPPTGSPSTGDAIPANAKTIEIRVRDVRQLFNLIDPSPFGERALDHGAEEFILEAAKEAPRSAQLALLVYLEQASGKADEGALLRDAVHKFFGHRAAVTRRHLRELFRRGRISLVIGIAFLGGFGALANALSALIPAIFGGVLRDTVAIGGWVAMWGPMEIFLYDWWPIRAEAKLFDRLAGMPVRIRYTASRATEEWRLNWPAGAPAQSQLNPGVPEKRSDA